MLSVCLIGTLINNMEKERQGKEEEREGGYQFVRACRPTQRGRCVCVFSAGENRTEVYVWVMNHEHPGSPEVTNTHTHTLLKGQRTRQGDNPEEVTGNINSHRRSHSVSVCIRKSMMCVCVCVRKSMMCVCVCKKEHDV